MLESVVRNGNTNPTLERVETLHEMEQVTVQHYCSAPYNAIVDLHVEFVRWYCEHALEVESQLRQSLTRGILKGRHAPHELISFMLILADLPPEPRVQA